MRSGKTTLKSVEVKHSITRIRALRRILFTSLLSCMFLLNSVAQADKIRVGICGTGWIGSSMRQKGHGMPEKVAGHLLETLKQEGCNAVLIGKEDLQDEKLMESLDVIFLPGGWRSYGFMDLDTMRALTDFTASGKGVLAGMFRSGPFTNNNRPLFPQVGSTYFKSNGSFVFPKGDSPLVKNWDSPYCVMHYDHTIQKVGPDGNVFGVDSGGRAVGVYGNVFGGRYVIWGSFFSTPLTEPLQGLSKTIFMNCIRWLAAAPERSESEVTRDCKDADLDLMRRSAYYNWLLDNYGPDNGLGILYQLKNDLELRLLSRAWQIDAMAAELSGKSFQKVQHIQGKIDQKLDYLNRNYEAIRAARENEIKSADLEELKNMDPACWSRDELVEKLSQVVATPGNSNTVVRCRAWAEAGRHIDGKLVLKLVYGNALSEQMLPEKELRSVLAAADREIVELRPVFVKARKASLAKALKEDRKKVAGLIKQCESDDSNTREAAALELGRIGDDRAVDALVKLVGDNDADVRTSAILALGWMQAKKGVPVLVSATEDENVWIRRRAVQALGQIGDPVGQDALLKAMNDPDFHVQLNAIMALGWIKSEKAVDPLVELVGKGDREDPHVRELMIAGERALGHIGDNRALPVLEHWRDTADDCPRFRGNREIVNRYTLSGSIGLEGAAKLAIEEIEAGGKPERGLMQPEEMRTVERFYGLNRNFSMLAGRAYGNAQKFFDSDGELDLDAFFASIISRGGNGVNCGWTRPRMNIEPEDYKDIVRKAGEYGMKWIETMPSSALGIFHGPRHKYKHYLGTYGANLGKPTAEITIVDYQDLPALQGFWQEECGPTYKLDVPRTLKEFENYLVSTYGKDYRKQLGLKPDEPLAGEDADKENRKLTMAKQDFQEFKRAHEWREQQQWLKGARKGCTFCWNKGGGHVEAPDICEAIDGAGLEAYHGWEPRQTMHMELMKDGELRAVQCEFYTFRDPSLRYSELGFAKHLMHGECYFPWSFYRIMRPDPYVWYWERGRWDVLSDVFKKGRTLQDYLAGAASGATVAMVYSKPTRDRFTEGEGPLSGRYEQHMLGIWMMLQQAHIPSDAIWAQSLSPEKLERYDVLVLSDAKILTPEQVAVIRDWVKAGNVLIATGASGLFDRWGDPMKDYLLADVFGVSYTAHREVTDPEKSDTFCFVNNREPGMQCVKIIDEGEDPEKLARHVHRENKPHVSLETYTVPKSSDLLWAIPSGFTCEYDLPLGYSLVKPDSAQVLASWKNGDPALTANQFGKGVCYLWTPSYPGLCYVPADIAYTPLYFKFWPGIRELFAGMIEGGLSQVDAKLPVEVSSCPPEVEVTVRRFPDKKQMVVHLLNYDINNDIVEGANMLVRVPDPTNARAFYPDTNEEISVLRTPDGVGFGLRDFTVHDMIVIEY